MRPAKPLLLACASIRSAWIVAALALLPATAGAHEFWLSPSTYRPAAGEQVAISAFVGTGFRGEPKPYAASRALHFSARAARDIDLRRLAVNGDLTMARIQADGGGALVAYQSNFASIELPAAEFDAYLKLEGLEGPLESRARSAPVPGRERYARCPKTWIAGSDPRRAITPAGLDLEIVPLSDPGSTAELSIRVLFKRKPLSGALVRAWKQPLGTDWAPHDPAHRDSVGFVVNVRTDGRGMATLKGLGPGEWLVSTVHMKPSADRKVADWESLWASLTFARGDGK
jgi:uncharacterized GH25 family protein